MNLLNKCIFSWAYDLVCVCVSRDLVCVCVSRYIVHECPLARGSY